MDESNPYISPQDLEPARQVPARKRISPYVSGHLRAMLAVAFFALNILARLTLLVVSLSRVALMDQAISGHPYTVEEGSAHDVRFGLATIAVGVTHLAAAIVFLCWLYRAYKNLPALGAGKLEFSPGWAIGCWFVPFLNFVRPFQVVRETWLASNPDYAGEGKSRWRRGESSPLLGMWWGAFLIMCIYSRVTARMPEGKTLVDLRSEGYLTAVEQLIAVVAAVLAVLVVLGINKRQEESYARISSPGFVPPSDLSEL